MPVHVEVWDARSSWLALSIPDRIAYLDRMGADIQALTDAGASLLGMVLRESQSPRRASCRYVAVWSMPDDSCIRRLDEMLAGAGWHTYFTRGDEHGAPIGPKSLFEYAAEREAIDRLPSMRRN
jgi:hypothetical protein